MPVSYINTRKAYIHILTMTRILIFIRSVPRRGGERCWAAGMEWNERGGRESDREKEEGWVRRSEERKKGGIRSEEEGRRKKGRLSCTDGRPGPRELPCTSPLPFPVRSSQPSFVSAFNFVNMTNLLPLPVLPFRPAPLADARHQLFFVLSKLLFPVLSFRSNLRRSIFFLTSK